MTIRKYSNHFIAVIVTATLLYAGTTLAVGFGDITLKSVLNEPLHAEIGLNNLGGLKNSEMRAQLGSAAAFSRAGISRDSHLTELDFSIIDNIWGERVISITSDKPVVEPFLDFLVQLEWPGGRIMREYTVLLDLPIYNTRQIITSVTSPANARAASQAGPQSGAGVQNISGTQHRVVEGDTLWNVAKRLKPSGLTILQTMDALYGQNASAFVEGDANRLKKGAIIRLPSKTEISREAGDLVAEQIGLRANTVEETPAWALDNEVTNEPQNVIQTDDELFLEAVFQEDQETAGGRLELASAYDINEPEVLFAETEASSEVLSGSEATADLEPVALDAVAANEIQQLTSKLSLAEDEINKTQLENIELRERIALLQAQVDTLATLVEVAERNRVNEQEKSIPKTAGKSASSDQIISLLQQQPWYVWGGLGALILLLLFMLRRTSAPVGEEDSLADVTDNLAITEPNLEPQPNKEPQQDAEPQPVQEPQPDKELQPDVEPQPDTEPQLDKEPQPNNKAEPSEEPAAHMDEEPEKLAADSPEVAGSEESVQKTSEVNPQIASDDLEDLELVGDQDIDELAASVLDEDFLDDGFMDGGIFADITPVESSDSGAQVAADDELNVFSTSLDDFEDLDDVAEINPVDVKLDLANTYIEMGDSEGAREILEEIIGEADDLGQARAQAVLDRLDNKN